MSDPVKDFFEVCTTDFDFLVEEFGFRRKAKKRDAGVYRVPYESARAKVEVGFEWREQYIYVLLGKPGVPRWKAEGRLPSPSDELTGFNLEDLLSLRAPGGGLDAKTFGRALEREDIEHVCGTYARALREHAADVLRGDFSVMPAMARIMNERAEKYSRP
jgi:hypothetical protein